MTDSVRNHANLPCNQPFNINGSRCKSKRQSWWNVASPMYFRLKGAKKNKNSFTQNDAPVAEVQLEAA